MLLPLVCILTLQLPLLGPEEQRLSAELPQNFVYGWPTMKSTLIATLAVQSLGLKRKAVGLITVPESWNAAYQQAERSIAAALAPLPYKIEHVGSSAVPGLEAKPILDILVIYPAGASFAAGIEKLEAFGFTYKGDAIAKMQVEAGDAQRHFFALYDDEEIDYIHIHALPVGHPHIHRLVHFRDLLLADAELRTGYAQLKRDLHGSGNSRQDYTLRKTAFIEAALRKL